jgi:gas vesicle protein
MPHHEPQAEGSQEEGGRRGGAGRFVVAGLLGALVGAGAALLLSPWRGAEARLQLKERGKEFAEAAKRKFREKTGRGEE